MYQSFFKTKLYLLFATLEFSRRYEKESISVYMGEPGTFKSDLVRDVPAVGWLKNLFSAPVEKAAGHMLNLITREGAKNKNGKLYTKGKEVPLTDYWKDLNIGQQLLSITDSLIDSKI